MEVRYEDHKLERLCTNEREMRKRRSDIADKLQLRINALQTARTVGDLVTLDPLGRWHALTEDRAGTWAGKLSANYRLIIRPEGAEMAANAVTVVVLEITDYHD